jgi:hypothetical protein
MQKLSGLLAKDFGTTKKRWLKGRQPALINERFFDVPAFSPSWDAESVIGTNRRQMADERLFHKAHFSFIPKLCVAFT